MRTLHGLAHDIVRERPELASLSENFQIVDEREANRILEESVQSWLHSYPAIMLDYLHPEIGEGRADWVKRQQLPFMVNSLASSFIRYAKDLRLPLECLRQKLDDLPIPLQLAQYVVPPTALRMAPLAELQPYAPQAEPTFQGSDEVLIVL